MPYADDLDIRITDTSLRDGSHAKGHQFDEEMARSVIAGLDSAGVPVIEVTHGDGLGGSSFNYGFSKVSERTLMKVAVETANRAKIAALMLPGLGTMDDIAAAADIGVSVIRIATHATEADISVQHFGLARDLGLETVGFLMMAHSVRPAMLAEQGRIMVDAGCQCVYVVDSAGALVLEQVGDRVSALVAEIGSEAGVGFHGHENLALGVANSVCAIRAGAMFAISLITTSMSRPSCSRWCCPIARRRSSRWPIRWGPRSCCVPPGDSEFSPRASAPSASLRYLLLFLFELLRGRPNRPKRLPKLLIDLHLIPGHKLVRLIRHANDRLQFVIHRVRHPFVPCRRRMRRDAVVAVVRHAHRHVQKLLRQRIERPRRHDLLDSLPRPLQRLRIVRDRLPEIVDPVRLACRHDVVVHRADFRSRVAIFDQRKCRHEVSQRSCETANSKLAGMLGVAQKPQGLTGEVVREPLSFAPV